MFDDNIGRPDSACGAHITDVRDVATGDPVPFDVALRRHLVRAEPFLAIDVGGGVGGPSTADVAAAVADAADATVSRDNFFLLELLKRLAPERVQYDARSIKINGVGDGFSASPEP